MLLILHDYTAGDSMRQEVRWTNLSRRNISRQLEKTETPASKNVVSLRKKERWGRINIEKTETTTGLKVVVKIIDKVFEKGRQYAADFKGKMSIQFDKLLPKWNYTAVPDEK